VSEVASAIHIRRELPADRLFVANLLREAFGGAAEARLVARLRAEGATLFGLVAEDDGGAILGHIAFSRLEVRSGERALDAASLAPVAVAPERQGAGIGASLVRAGIEECRKQNLALIVVLGEPAYYARFGFSAEAAKRLDAPYSGEAFMALELTPNVLDGVVWKVVYPRAFAVAG
jgi:putative acetyltransferase